MSAGHGLSEDSPSRFESETRMELAKAKCGSKTWELSRLRFKQIFRNSRSAAATSSLFADSVVETPLVWSSITTLAGEDLPPLCLPRPPLHSASLKPCDRKEQMLGFPPSRTMRFTSHCSICANITIRGSGIAVAMWYYRRTNRRRIPWKKCPCRTRTISRP